MNATLPLQHYNACQQCDHLARSLTFELGLVCDDSVIRHGRRLSERRSAQNHDEQKRQQVVHALRVEREASFVERVRGVALPRRLKQQQHIVTFSIDFTMTIMHTEGPYG